MPHPPTGTVTFLFTDIEGSTRLWDENPGTMQNALARHDRILRRSIENCGGFVFKTLGDAFCAAFATAPEAVHAALAAQLALSAEPWTTAAPLRVRMALHTGTVDELGGDYFGPALNRVTRMLATGHGGQTLLSLASQELTRDALPIGSSLLDLGRHRLRDLGRPEQIFQILHPDLSADFPPLRSLDNPKLPNNLPQQTTSFIGREAEIRTAKSLLDGTRLLTLTGAGGSGKTRLSLQMAADLLRGDGDGVWLVELAPISDPTLVPQAMAQVLGLREDSGKPIRESLTDFLKDKHMLLVLDNAEHVLAACATLVTDLLRTCPDVKVLASSREPLNVAGEQTYRVPSLSLPSPDTASTMAAFSQYEAVRLFIERAQAVQPEFAVTDRNAPTVAQICWRLDGIPLAIELAAARVRMLSAEEINARLDDRFRLLTNGSRTLLPRQQTLRALIDWSYDLLTEREKASLQSLAVFSGGWTLRAAEAVCIGECGTEGGTIEEWDVLDLLTALANKSLVTVEAGADSTRYHLLETIRQYAAERLRNSDRAGAAQQKHADWCRILAEEAEPQLMGPEQAAWLSRLEAEHDNIRAAFSWHAQTAEGAADGLSLASSLWRFWYVRGHWSEGRGHLEDALARTSPTPLARAKALNSLGNIVWSQGEYEVARDYFGQALEINRALEDRRGQARNLNNLGGIANAQGQYAAARTFLEQALAINRTLEDQTGEVNNLLNLGILAKSEGDYPQAQTCYEQALSISRALGHRGAEARNLNALGIVHRDLGDYGAARSCHEHALTICRHLEDKGAEAQNLNNLGLLSRDQGEYAAAQDCYEQALTISRAIGDRELQAASLGNLGSVARDIGDCDSARSFLEQALEIFHAQEDRKGEARNLNNLGTVAWAQQDYASAQSYYEQAWTISQTVTDDSLDAEILINRARLARVTGEDTPARALLTESLTLTRRLCNPKFIAEALEEWAALAGASGRPADAARLAGAAERTRETLPIILPSEQKDSHESLKAAARAALGGDAFAVTWSEGRDLTWEQAADYAQTDGNS